MLSGEVLLMALLRLPFDLSFVSFAFADRGSWLTVHRLVSHGARPAIDFGYAYGMLPIWLSAGWFGIFGATPYAYQAAMTACGIAMAWAIARMARSFRLARLATAFLFVALPFAIQSTFPSAANAVEGALLCNALAEHAAGRRDRALALTTASCFSKPSMGYVYGLILLILIQIEIYRRRNEPGRNSWSAALRTLTPALITGTALIAILSAAYGPLPLGRTLLPLVGIKDYAALNFGFFHGGGSYFWYGTPPLLCLLSVIGFWFAASLWLLASATFALWRLLRGHSGASRWRDEFVVTAAILHVLFVVAFFGGPGSWTYYSYLLVMGAAAGCYSGGRILSAVTFALVLLATAAQTAHRAADISLWRTSAPGSDTGGLWASTKDREQWVALITALRGKRAALISAQGCAPLFAPRSLEPNDFAYLLPDMTTAQFESALRKFTEAPTLLVVVAPGYGCALDVWPRLRGLLAKRKLVLRNDFYALYRNSDIP